MAKKNIKKIEESPDFLSEREAKKITKEHEKDVLEKTDDPKLTEDISKVKVNMNFLKPKIQKIMTEEIALNTKIQVDNDVTKVSSLDDIFRNLVQEELNPLIQILKELKNEISLLKNDKKIYRLTEVKKSDFEIR